MSLYSSQASNYSSLGVATGGAIVAGATGTAAFAGSLGISAAIGATVAGGALAASSVVFAPFALLALGLISSTKTTTWDNSGEIAGNRATESKQYQTMNRSVADVKASMGIQQLSQADSWLKNKANEQNTITQTTKEDTSSWFGLAHDVEYSYQYWQESNDQLLGRYGYETYAQKATNLTESLKWMEVKDMNKLNSDVLLAEVKDTAGQDVERQIAGNQMNNYFGQYYVDATKV